ncbi:hypothetical protein [Amycolatopsis sp. GM8]|uniref:hypothetical protein n=1 Tax=Amycolatopsis sp. GM8 TaxID=2896530 RepID=UPI001F2CD566|nr:hypothetical protein [Amycolatopsis sp. GM8]
MLRLVADDPALTLSDRQVQRLTFWVLEFLPASRCEIRSGPGAEILVAEREPNELTSALRAKFEEIAGCCWLDAT